MRNPEVTKETILKKSGILFNTKGYKATSISNVTKATGYTKGAIYRHFASKNELEREAMEYLSAIALSKLRDQIKKENTASDKLRALFKFFETYITSPPVKGGCPLLNAAIEADDSHPALRKEALNTLNILRESLNHILSNGIKYKQLKPGIDLEFYSTIIIASLEGGIMMSKLERNSDDMSRIIQHLHALLKEIEI